MSVSAPTRITPLGRMSDFRAQRIWERNLLVYRRIWTLVVTGFFEPVFYLLSLGVGLGAMVDPFVIDGRLVTYAAFMAPAMMATSAMNGAVMETTFNIFFKLRFGNVYQGMLTTPLQPRDIAVGEIGWALFRGSLYTAVFLGVMWAMGLVETPWALMTIPGAVLIGFAFGSVGLAACTWMRSWQDFDLVSMVTMPLFLFSGTFFPVAAYPAALRFLVQLSPLYHGVELLRSLTLGIFDPSLVGHVAFLLVMGVIGATIASRRIDGLLRK